VPVIYLATHASDRNASGYNKSPRNVLPEHILFLTGRLAEQSLHKVLQEMQPTEFTYRVHQIGISVAALMTADLVARRLKDTFDAHRIVLPGHCRGDIDALSQRLGIPVERGPKELKDLPQYFGREAAIRDLSGQDVQIFAEIVDAPDLGVDAILQRAERYRNDGADVIDLGCLPSTPFPHMSEAIQALKQAGFSVSIDSLDTDDLIRGARAGADYLLSLTEESLFVADEVAATPILIPVESRDLDSLCRAVETLGGSDRRFIVDPILEPIHAGFTDSIVRYHAVRQRYPKVEVMMGTGNLTELTHADTAGNTALLMGIISELGIGHILTTEVSPHCRTVVRESDLARRIMYAARAHNTPPRLIDDGLLALHERKPFPYNLDEIKSMAAAIKDPNYRIQVTEEGMHIYNRDGFHTGQDPLMLYPNLGVEDDGGHAFYLGMELARAQIAWQLGKHYAQDEELKWAFAVEPPKEDLERFTPEGPTLVDRRHRLRAKNRQRRQRKT
jgi:dihydropteroate synthase